MRRGILSVLVLSFLVLSVAQYAFAIPYWAKNATITYRADYYAPYVEYRVSLGHRPEWTKTGYFTYNYSGMLYYGEVYGPVVVRFNLTGDGEFVNVTVEFLLKNVNITTVLPPGYSPLVFWNESDVTSNETAKDHLVGFNDWKWYVFHLRQLRITGKYRIRVNDSMVVKDGVVYGHTMLWDDPEKPLVNGSLFSVYPFKSRIDDVQIDNEQVFKGKNITIKPPTKLVTTTEISYNGTQRLKGVKKARFLVGGYGIMMFRFDASNGLLISPPLTAPDFWALGFLSASFIDEYHEYQVVAKGDKSYLTGLVLANFTTGVKRQEETVNYPKPQTGLKWAFYSSILLLAGVIGWKTGKSTKKWR
ncbi:hypothetical protein [Thermococcus celer]|uniref:Thermopsin n=1 Tax=Thermococcus celer Vu 13 = JCM 8558 TaxID=1293037 RepID=A0A218P3S7_THECE|nr:hypothetical protein [Thermococcus celer]ASI99567.1 hypothetical protein A3L02_08355 [Thermococcus celer Vu 13 = JCM 8558]